MSALREGGGRAARRHRVLLAAAAVLVIGGGISGAILSSSPSYRGTRPIQTALGKSPLVGAAQGHGHSLVQEGVPTIVRFVPGATFAIAVIITNHAGEQV